MIKTVESVNNYRTILLHYTKFEVRDAFPTPFIIRVGGISMPDKIFEYLTTYNRVKMNSKNISFSAPN